MRDEPSYFHEIAEIQRVLENLPRELVEEVAEHYDPAALPTRWDLFAAAALARVPPQLAEPEEVARRAALVADAMMAESLKRSPP